MNMFKKVKAKSVKEYLDMLEDPRKKDVLFLHDFIQNISPVYSPHFAYNMLGYGVFKYKNYKKEIIDWPIVALANQKNYISIYVCSLEKGKYLAEIFKNKLGNVSVGKSCIRFKKLDNLNLKVLGQILLLASKNPGLAS